MYVSAYTLLGLCLHGFSSIGPGREREVGRHVVLAAQNDGRVIEDFFVAYADRRPSPFGLSEFLFILSLGLISLI
jgi:hypothetical protein